jgi:hypothetical protein
MIFSEGLCPEENIVTERNIAETLLAVVSELRRNHCEQMNDRFM